MESSPLDLSTTDNSIDQIKPTPPLPSPSLPPLPSPEIEWSDAEQTNWLKSLSDFLAFQLPMARIHILLLILSILVNGTLPSGLSLNKNAMCIIPVARA
eukprot:scaffold10172_cov62-Cyclotella_meneghiniana.AAC.8